MCIKSLYLIAALCFWASGQACAQQIELNETVSIKSMVDGWSKLNRSTTRLSGWRIQVAASTDRFEAQTAKDRFASLYPTIAADWYHDRPYYKVKAGAFQHAWEARKVIAAIRADFSGAYPVFDKKIKPTDFMPVTIE
jgi:SPOR domain